jgi:hypothetical protein
VSHTRPLPSNNDDTRAEVARALAERLDRAVAARDSVRVMNLNRLSDMAGFAREARNAN